MSTNFFSILFFLTFSLLFFKFQLCFSINSECQGCSIFSTCDVTFVENNVYGCGGIWDNDASYLCNDGYEICSSSKYAFELGLTFDLCLNSPLQKNYFYMSLQTIDNNENNIFMTNDINTELLGCVNKNSDSWLFINKNSYNNNVFGAQLSIIDSDEAWKFGWAVVDDEVKHTYSAKNVGGNVMGGVLCCLSSTNSENKELNDLEKKPTTTATSQGPKLLPTKDASHIFDDVDDDDDESNNNNILNDENNSISTTNSEDDENNSISTTNSEDDDDDDDSSFKSTTSTTIIPIETGEITTTTLYPTNSPTTTPTRGLTPKKCCHAYFPNRYELRCNLLNSKNICADATVARRCYWNASDCDNGGSDPLPTKPNTACRCTGSGERKQYFCSQYNDRSTCMYQNCHWECA